MQNVEYSNGFSQLFRLVSLFRLPVAAATERQTKVRVFFSYY